ncbi:MAG TPA: carboxypeptidase regulatory-like domain-containing protein [Coriobacteriaceae bacterium]|nr:carboxypeptidase regulatory-like domain-containing protein [Coriobacteriaceae bacterium]
MSKVFVIDVDKCNGCHNCQVACKDEHCGQAWLPYAEAQPLTGQFWMKVNEKERGQVPVVRVSYLPHLCNHCENPACEKAAPDAVYKREDGLVIIDPEKARGNSNLVDACPVGAIFWNEELSLPQKCTGCAHLLDDGWEVPRCGDACPTEALRYIDEEEVDLANAVTLPELAGTGPKVYYLNYPKRFVAGLVYDPEADEVIIDGKVTLKQGEAVVQEMRTDDFGDFKFEQVDPGNYEIIVESAGYDTAHVGIDLSEKDRFVGDIAMNFVGNPSNRPSNRIRAQEERAIAQRKWDASIEALKQKGVVGSRSIAVICPTCGKKVNTALDVESPRCQFCKADLTAAVEEKAAELTR